MADTINDIANAKITEFFDNYKENKAYYGLGMTESWRSAYFVYLDTNTGITYISATSNTFYEPSERFTVDLRFVFVPFIDLKDRTPSTNDNAIVSRTILLNPQEILTYYKTNRPTEYNWVMKNFKSEKLTKKLVTRLKLAVVWPELVQLNILGYTFTNKLCNVETYRWDAHFERICKDKYGYRDWTAKTEYETFWLNFKGNGPKEIFYPIPEKMIKTLKDATIETIYTLKNIYSGYDKEHAAENKDRIVQFLKSMHLDTYEEIISSEFNDSNFWQILSAKHNGKPIYSYQNLIDYLGRLDTFQAISRREALRILRDYLAMCEKLGMAPDKYTNSLKREHDIAVRNYNARQDECSNRKIAEVGEEISKFNYVDKSAGLFIRSITDFEDLKNEGIKMHNCVGSYSNRIINGYSYIFVIRSIKHPDDSIITVELNPENLSVVQQYLSYNRSITDERQLQFINDWHRHCLKVNSNSVKPDKYVKAVYNIVHNIVEEEEEEINLATVNLIKELVELKPEYNTSAEEKALMTV